MKNPSDMKNQSAEFRALREIFGLTQNNIGDALARTRMTVKYWENPDCATNPPDFAWAYMKNRMESQTELVAKTVAEAEKNAVESEDGKKTARLLFYRDQPHYDVNHPDEDEKEIYGAANSAACTAAVMLIIKGYEIEWDYPPTPKALGVERPSKKKKKTEEAED